ncbi:hypothetical protein M0804_012139 [Polistes exclamans]|nr:hypothetical protein M0804_012139 [Polistes exclamans]
MMMMMMMMMMMIEMNRVTLREMIEHIPTFLYVVHRHDRNVVEVVVVAQGNLGRGDRTVQLGFREGKERNERNVLPSGLYEPILSPPPPPPPPLLEILIEKRNVLRMFVTDTPKIFTDDISVLRSVTIVNSTQQREDSGCIECSV